MDYTLYDVEDNLSPFEKFVLFLILALLSLPQLLSASMVLTSLLIMVLLLYEAIDSYRSSEKIVLSLDTLSVVLILFFAYILADRGPLSVSEKNYNWSINYACLILLPLINTSKNANRVVYCAKVMAWVNLINAGATILFWILPGLYPAYKAVFLKGFILIKGEGYKAGLTSHYSTNGMVLTLGLLSAFALIPRDRKKYGALTAIFLLVIVLTTKRAHLIFGVMACVIVYFSSNLGRAISKIVKIIFILLAIVGLWYVAAQYFPVLGEVFVRLQDTEDSTRAMYWAMCLSLFLKNPVFGNGWKAFAGVLYSSPISRSLVAWGNTGQDAHNVYLQILAEQGIVGETLFIIVVSVAMARTLGMLKRQPDEEELSDVSGYEWQNDRVALRLSLGLQCFILMYCLTGNPLYTSTMYVPWLLSLGACAA